mmetsp:Transcript_91467/g.295970  ORF Transcript_91467/g.295970 Transcript_91467/m.295970 type:complete len:222 (-) Transcript_91467:201-866(-)
MSQRRGLSAGCCIWNLPWRRRPCRTRPRLPQTRPGKCSWIFSGTPRISSPRASACERGRTCSEVPESLRGPGPRSGWPGRDSPLELHRREVSAIRSRTIAPQLRTRAPMHGVALLSQIRRRRAPAMSSSPRGRRRFWEFCCALRRLWQSQCCEVSGLHGGRRNFPVQIQGRRARLGQGQICIRGTECDPCGLTPRSRPPRYPRGFSPPAGVFACPWADQSA